MLTSVITLVGVFVVLCSAPLCCVCRVIVFCSSVEKYMANQNTSRKTAIGLVFNVLAVLMEVVGRTLSHLRSFCYPWELSKFAWLWFWRYEDDINNKSLFHCTRLHGPLLHSRFILLDSYYPWFLCKILQQQHNQITVERCECGKEEWTWNNVRWRNEMVWDPFVIWGLSQISRFVQQRSLL